MSWVKKKLKVDKNGRYWIKTNGNVYRPDKTKYDYPIVGRTYETVFKVGEEVKVRHITQSPFIEVTDARGTREVWGYHGSYYDKAGVPIEDIWGGS